MAVENDKTELDNDKALDLAAPEKPDFYIGIGELAKRLSLSQRTIRTYLHQPDNPLPAYQIGNKLLFFWPEVQAWVRKYKVKTIDVDSMVDDITLSFQKE